MHITNGIATIESDLCISKWVRESGRLDHDQNMLPLLKPFIPLHGVVFDIGAFIGDHTIFYSNAVGEKGKVYAFEPSKEAFECLDYNLNYKPNTFVYNMALGNTKGFVSTNEVEDNAGMNFITESEKGVILDTLDNFVENNNITQIDFIKIDVEGYELEVLKGAEKSINKFKPTLLIELNDLTLYRAGISRKDIFDFLDKNGYIYRNIYKEKGIDEYQMDLISYVKENKNK